MCDGDRFGQHDTENIMKRICQCWNCGNWFYTLRDEIRSQSKNMTMFPAIPSHLRCVFVDPFCLLPATINYHSGISLCFSAICQNLISTVITVTISQPLHLTTGRRFGWRHLE